MLALEGARETFQLLERERWIAAIPNARSGRRASGV